MLNFRTASARPAEKAVWLVATDSGQTLDLPEDLLKKAMRVSRMKTRTATITTALEELVRKSRLQGLREFKGKVDLDVDLDILRNRV